MPFVRLDIAYHGEGFRGWANQPGERTVQGELESALAIVLREPVGLTVAGRTDTGVHALGQVASFAMVGQPPHDLAWRLNGVGPPDISVLSANIVPDGFDARQDAVSRTYCYRLMARLARSPFEDDRALWWPRRFDLDAAQACAALLPGKHDFTAFTPTQTEHVHFNRRVLGAEWREQAGGLTDSGVLEFWITADAFMRSMVRIIVGTTLEVASGRRSLEDFGRLLKGAHRTEAGDTAAARGLHLVSVAY